MSTLLSFATQNPVATQLDQTNSGVLESKEPRNEVDWKDNVFMSHCIESRRWINLLHMQKITCGFLRQAEIYPIYRMRSNKLAEDVLNPRTSMEGGGGWGVNP